MAKGITITATDRNTNESLSVTVHNFHIDEVISKIRFLFENLQTIRSGERIKLLVEKE